VSGTRALVPRLVEAVATVESMADWTLMGAYDYNQRLDQRRRIMNWLCGGKKVGKREEGNRWLEPIRQLT
jgi:hypothetical protein